MTQLERDIERKLRLQVEAQGGKCLKWICPGWSGVPDRIVLLPGGRVLFVELKRPKDGKLSKLQRWWHIQLEQMGFTCRVVWDQEDLTSFFANIKKYKE